VISVVICTFNRFNLLKSTLDSLIDQTNKDFELIIVDNNSKDETSTVADLYSYFFAEFKYIVELNAGLSYARNRGVLESTYEYVAFIDDDVLLPSTWAANVLEVSVNKSPDIFGGPVFPYYPKDKPDWYKDEYISFYCGNIPRYLNENETLIGCNFVVKKDVFERIGWFRTDLGMIENTILYSEETEFQMRYRKINKTSFVYYFPKISIYHYVRPEKMTIIWNIRAFIGKGKSNYLKSEAAKTYRQSNFRFFVLINELIKIFVIALYGIFFRSRKDYPIFSNFLMERLAGNFKKLGWIFAQI
tara:strand:- start:15033 stop:15938 length:906 start_codon:yes stop_codon:yes gene_type:complete